MQEYETETYETTFPFLQFFAVLNFTLHQFERNHYLLCTDTNMLCTEPIAIFADTTWTTE